MTWAKDQIFYQDSTSVSAEAGKDVVVVVAVVEVVAVVVAELFVVVDAVEAQEWSLRRLDDTGPCCC